MSAAGATQEEDKKPNDQSAHINLKVKGQVPFLFFIIIFNFFLISSQFGSDLVDWLGFVALIGSCNVEFMMQSR